MKIVATTSLPAVDRPNAGTPHARAKRVKCVLRESDGYFTEVQRVFRKCFKGVLGDVLGVFQGSVQDVLSLSIIFLDCF